MSLSTIGHVLLALVLINTTDQSYAIVIKFEDVDVTYVNGEFVDENTFDISVNYINATYSTLRCKADVLKKFPEDTRIIAKLYGYAFGNYRVPMGLNVNTSTCDLKTKTMFMAPFITAIGGDLDKCGPDVGEYGNESFIPINFSKLPSVFPANKYLIDVEVSNNDLKIVQAQFFINLL
ncbi:uncharacterized protein LOC131663611 [Phymastichus coffea]|uniref:uncharacterized protein LOC131663611 n=1 Tax=Phymastichus coffea TaxID=108790 RepID=UPI00273B44C7|nr:uncharacterized protein LOC131663611 [Phymastichus coffea]